MRSFSKVLCMVGRTSYHRTYHQVSTLVAVVSHRDYLLEREECGYLITSSYRQATYSEMLFYHNYYHLQSSCLPHERRRHAQWNRHHDKRKATRNDIQSWAPRTFHRSLGIQLLNLHRSGFSFPCLDHNESHQHPWVPDRHQIFLTIHALKSTENGFPAFFRFVKLSSLWWPVSQCRFSFRLSKPYRKVYHDRTFYSYRRGHHWRLWPFLCYTSRTICAQNITGLGVRRKIIFPA